MNILSKEEILWASFLAKQPTKKARKRRYLWEGFLFYLIMIRRCPIRAIGEIVGLAFIGAAMVGLVVLAGVM
jgi:hypothetical protein